MGEVKTEIKGKITVDTGNSPKTIGDLNKAIATTREELKLTTIGSAEHTKALKTLADQQAKLKVAMTDSTAETKKSGEAFGMLKDRLGSTVPGFKSATEGSGIFNEGLNVLRANPIILVLTLIVAALKALYDRFASTKEGADKLGAVFAGIGAVVEVITERVVKFASAIYNFFTGNWKQAAADFQSTFKGIGQEIEDRYDQTVRIHRELQQLKDDELADSYYASIRQSRLAILKEQLGDEQLTAREKLKIAKQLSVDIKQNQESDERRAKAILERENHLLQMKSGLSTEQYSMLFYNKKKFNDAETESEREKYQKEIDMLIAASHIKEDDLKKQFDLLIKFNNQVTENANESRQAIKAVNNAQRQVTAEDKERSDEAKAKAKEAHDADMERRRQLYEYRTGLAKQEQEIELALMRDGQVKELTIINNKLEDQRAANRKLVEDKKLTAEQAAAIDALAEQLANVQRSAIINKYREQEKTKEREFRAELSKIRIEIELADMVDSRQRERRQLDISFEDKYRQAREKYKDNADRLKQFQLILAIQQQQAETALQKKFDTEDLGIMRTTSLARIAFETTLARNDLRAKRRLLEEKQSIINAQYEEEVNAAALSAFKKAAIEQKHVEDLYAFSQAKKAIDQGEANAKIAALDAVSSTLDSASKLIGEKTAAGKALAMASTVISTYTSAQKAYESTVGIPFVGPFLAPINAGLAVAVGLKNLREIAKVNIPGAGGGGSSATPSVSSGSSVSGPIAPQNSTTSLNQSSINGVANAALGGVNRAFILDSDITNAAERNARINRAARLN